QRLAADGYNQQAERYLEWLHAHKHPRLEMLQRLYHHLCLNPASGEGEAKLRVLELGCGAGDPVTLSLASNPDVKHVVANDISTTQIEMLRTRLAELGADVTAKVDVVESDMMALDLQPESFDAAVAFYSIIHLRREDQTELIGRLHRWLKAGKGVLLFCVPVRATEGEVEEDWLGMKAFWSSWGVDGSVRMVEEVGFEVV
ncbi:hypothetical protein BAUCODRAFT_60626, partial [Baudoinia panamericana UAMH 10762]